MNNDIPVVGEIFIPLEQFPHVHPDDAISSGIMQLLQSGTADGRHLHFDEVLVVDDTNRLVGQLSMKTILKNLFPVILANDLTEAFVGKKTHYSDLSILLEGHFQNACRRQSEVTVKSCMAAPARTIERSTHLLHALEIMVSDDRMTLPVSDGKVLLGGIRMADLFRILGGHCTMPGARI